MVVRLHPHTKGHGQGGVDETCEAGSVWHGVDAPLGFLGHVGVESDLWVCVVFVAHGDPLWSTGGNGQGLFVGSGFLTSISISVVSIGPMSCDSVPSP